VLVLLSFALVLVATVLLVLGLLSDDGITLIYLSIASSVAAALVLVVALKLNKPRDEVRSSAPEPLPVPEPALAGAAATTSSSASSLPTSSAASAVDDGEWLASDQDDWSSAEGGWQGDDEGAEVEFPIADYDTLTAGQILPLLPQLYADEIPVVEERERSTKARPEILSRLDELRGQDGGGADPGAEAVASATTDAGAGESPDPLATYTEPAASPTWDAEDGWFPIEDYESLSAAQIRPLLPELDAEELAMVREKEQRLGRRRSLLDEIERLIGDSAPPVPPAASTPPARPAPVSKRRSTSTTVRTGAAKRPSAAKRTGAATKAPVVKGTGRSVAKKVPSRTTSAGRPTSKAAAAQSASAKKATGARSAAAKAGPSKATTSKVTAANKASAKKVASAAKAPAKKAATAAAKKASATKLPAKKATVKRAAPTRAATKKAVAKRSPAKRPPRS